MSNSGKQIVLDVKYIANRRAEIVKNVLLGGFRLRESDGTHIMSLRELQGNRSFSIDIGAIEWIRVDGAAKKLRSPGTQHRLREAELRFLIYGKQREEWTDPYLRSYDHDEFKNAMKSKRGFFGTIISILGFAFLSLPGLGLLILAGGFLYMVYKLMNGVR